MRECTRYHIIDWINDHEFKETWGYQVAQILIGKEKAEEILNQVIFVIADADATNPLAKPDEVIN